MSTEYSSVADTPVVRWCCHLVVKTQTCKAHLSALAGTQRLVPDQQQRGVVLVLEFVAFGLRRWC